MAYGEHLFNCAVFIISVSDKLNRAAAHAFQKSNASQASASGEDPKMAESKLMSYIAFEKREGLVSIGKRLLNSKQY